MAARIQIDPLRGTAPSEFSPEDLAPQGLPLGGRQPNLVARFPDAELVVVQLHARAAIVLSAPLNDFRFRHPLSQ